MLLAPQQLQPHSRCICAAAGGKKARPQKKRLRKPKQRDVGERIRFTDLYEDEEDEWGAGADEASQARAAELVLMPSKLAPRAPPPAAAPKGKTAQPEDLYPVFPAQAPLVSRLPEGGGKWSWGEDRPSGAAQAPQQDVPMWNPKTGFMRSRADAGVGSSQQQQQAVAQAHQQQQQGHAATVQQQPQQQQKQQSAGSSLVEPLPQQAPQPLPPPVAGAQAGEPQLPAVSREQVLGSCAVTSLGMAAAALGLRWFAQTQAAGLFGTEQAAIERLLALPPGLQDARQAGWLLGAAGAVTAARFALLMAWPAFAAATERSNRQVLSPLGWPDVALVALLSGLSEEALFRGALVPASLPDARGVAAAGLLFGVLHVSGGRNSASAAWATAVGWLYGAAFLATGNVWVPAGAHALANFASAAAWRLRAQQQARSGSSGSGATQ